jgi:hypothetical protein
MLSHTVMSVVQVFPSSVMLSLAYVFVRDGLSSVEMWFNHGEDRCCGLSKDGRVETVGFRQVMWFIMLESAKDRILEVDTPGQYVAPRVRYETVCPLIRYVMSCVSCSVGWRWLLSLWSVFVIFFVNCLNHMVQKGPLFVGNLSTASGDCLSGNRRKAWHTPIVDLCNGMCQSLGHTPIEV